MYDLTIQDELNQALNDDFSVCINGKTYCVTPHFSVTGKETILEQFARLLTKSGIINGSIAPQ